jgi:hypothetical protein
VTDADLDRIEASLGITLPNAYRNLMGTRARELKQLTHQIDGVSYGWFDDLLYLDADRVIEVNLSERRPDAETEYAFPDWAKTFFLIGTNGAGDYYCLRLKGDRKVWMIGSDCGDEPNRVYGSLSEFVEEQIPRHAKDRPQQSPALSSFDDSCPLLERFELFIGRKVCQIKCQPSDAPVNGE